MPHQQPASRDNQARLVAVLVSDSGRKDSMAVKGASGHAGCATRTPRMLRAMFWLPRHTGMAPHTPSLLRIMSQLSTSGNSISQRTLGPSKAWLTSGTTPGLEAQDGMLHPIHPPEKPANDRPGMSSDATGRGPLYEAVC
ncbi:hypothetical protein GQ607_004234 [Colletotrichum asianum]|uniref:Uncharacterized protein n=1 Tax=Colletotrichum asianum TaxID=702518 RepID=A0A8H3WI38_9PEZI|nr:hypothetical protein GQ607_004234 [Colletotrichum asianum]